jgi:hypothetical protein
MLKIIPENVSAILKKYLELMTIISTLSRAARQHISEAKDTPS